MSEGAPKIKNAESTTPTPAAEAPAATVAPEVVVAAVPPNPEAAVPKPAAEPEIPGTEKVAVVENPISKRHERVEQAENLDDLSKALDGLGDLGWNGGHYPPRRIKEIISKARTVGKDEDFEKLIETLPPAYGLRENIGLLVRQEREVAQMKARHAKEITDLAAEHKRQRENRFKKTTAASAPKAAPAPAASTPEATPAAAPAPTAAPSAPEAATLPSETPSVPTTPPVESAPAPVESPKTAASTAESHEGMVRLPKAGDRVSITQLIANEGRLTPGKVIVGTLLSDIKLGASVLYENGQTAYVCEMRLADADSGEIIIETYDDATREDASYKIKIAEATSEGKNNDDAQEAVPGSNTNHAYEIPVAGERVESHNVSAPETVAQNVFIQNRIIRTILDGKPDALKESSVTVTADDTEKFLKAISGNFEGSISSTIMDNAVIRKFPSPFSSNERKVDIKMFCDKLPDSLLVKFRNVAHKWMHRGQEFNRTEDIRNRSDETEDTMRKFLERIDTPMIFETAVASFGETDHHDYDDIEEALYGERYKYWRQIKLLKKEAAKQYPKK